MNEEVLEYFGDMNATLGPVTLSYTENLKQTLYNT